MNEFVETIALKYAVANNGGTWAEHYNEDQKNYWRAKARELIEDVCNCLHQEASALQYATVVHSGDEYNPDLEYLNHFFKTMIVEILK